MRKLGITIVCCLTLLLALWPIHAQSLFIPITPQNANKLSQVGVFERGVVNALAWSPDGTTLAVATSVGIWLYDAAAFGKAPDLLPGWSGGVWFSPDSKRVVTNIASDQAMIWDIGSKKIGSMFGQNIADISPDWTKFIARDASVWDVATGKQLITLDQSELESGALTPVFNHKLTQIAYSKLYPIEPHVADLKTGHVVSRLDPIAYQESIKTLAFSPDDTMLVGGGGIQAGVDCCSGENYGNYVYGWDVASGKVMFAWADHGLRVGSVAFSPDGSVVASSSDDGTVRLRDPQTGIPRFKLAGGKALVFSPDSQYVASGAASDGSIHIWEVRTGREYIKLSIFGEQHINGNAPFMPYPLEFSPDSQQLASVDHSQNVRLWNIPSGQLALSFTHFNAHIDTLRFSPNGTQLATHNGFSTERMWLWDTKTGALTGLKEQTVDWEGKNLRVIFDHGYALVSIIRDGVLYIDDMRTNTFTERSFVFDNDGKGHANTLSTDGTRFAVIDPDGTVRIWDTTMGKQITSYSTPLNNDSATLLFSPNNMLLIIQDYQNGAIYILDSRTGREISTASPPQFDLGVSVDNRRFYSTWNNFYLWDTASGRLLMDAPSINVATLSPDGEIAAVATSSPNSYRYRWNYQPVRSGTITLYEAATGKPLATLKTDNDEVMGLAFSPDGRFLASVCLDDTVQLWAVASTNE